MLTIAGLQMNVSTDIEQNLERILKGIAQASQAGAQFLATPEGSLSGYHDQFEAAALRAALDEVEAAARQSKIGLILGTCYKETSHAQEVCYNQARLYAPEGNYLGAHAKILRCSPLDPPGTGEMVAYRGGELQTFAWQGIRFGALICNDLWATPGYTTLPNPYLPWQLQQMGAQIIVHLINSGTEQRYRAFHEASAELWAYALRLPIVEVNAAQGDETINACSGWIDAAGKRVLCVQDVGEQFFVCEVSAEAYR